MRITSKGQVTIPLDIRERAGLLPHMEVAFSYEDGVVRIFPARPAGESGRGARIVAHLRAHGGSGMSTDEIMALTRGE